jgi:hypothetical protein
VVLLTENMEIIELGYEELEGATELFSHAVEDDDWVLYHSTTSIAEDKIDAEGLACSLHHDEDLIALIKVFRAMNWGGNDNAGYPVLKGFSLQRGALPRVYFRNLLPAHCCMHRLIMWVAKLRVQCITA